ncbi:hypothetical protein D3C86_1996090 [compost metagenome]
MCQTRQLPQIRFAAYGLHASLRDHHQIGLAGNHAFLRKRLISGKTLHRVLQTGGADRRIRSGLLPGRHSAHSAVVEDEQYPFIKRS